MRSLAAEQVRYGRLLWIAAGLSGVAGIIHWVVSPEYLRQWWGYGFFFIWAGVLQMGYAFAIFLLPWLYASAPSGDPKKEAVMRRIYRLGAIGNGAIVLLYIITRTLGVPFVGPEANVVMPVTVPSVVATAAEIVLVGVLLVLARRRPGRLAEGS